MTDTSKPIVRLETSSAAKKAQKKAVAEAKEQTIKLAIRLNEGINEALRTLIPALVSAEERMVRDTTITMPRVLHKKLKKIADDRDSSMNILVNAAVAHWPANKVTLRFGLGAFARGIRIDPMAYANQSLETFFNATAFMQYRNPLGAGPSGKTCPR